MIRIFFDETEINPDRVKSLRQISEGYSERFSIGNTICRSFSASFVKGTALFIPEKVYLYEDNGSDNQSDWNLYASLYVDSINETNKRTTEYSFVDLMVVLNKRFSYTVGSTVEEILELIAQNHNVSIDYPSDLYMADYQISWEDNITEREFLSYVAEINGGYSYIDGEGNIVIDYYSNTPKGHLDPQKFSEFSIGDEHIIDRVYVELAEASVAYPASTEYDTLYLNPDNIFFNDTGTITITDVVRHIYDKINGLHFYNVSISKCPVLPNVRAGQIIVIDSSDCLADMNDVPFYTSDDAFLAVSNDVPFICQIDFDYYTEWKGGYISEFDNAFQEETHINDNIDQKIRRVDIKVDRETGVISRSVVQLSEDLQAGLATNRTYIEQTSDSILARVESTEADLEVFQTSVMIGADGVRITQEDADAYVMFTASGMDIYYQSQKVAWAEASGFSAKELMIGDPDDTEKWHMHKTNNGNTLMFLRRS